MTGPAAREHNETLSRLLRFFAWGGLIAYVPSVWLSAAEGLWLLVVVDTAAYGLVLAAAFVPGMPFGFKLGIVVAVSMAVGVAVLVMTGPFGAGYIWLLAAMILSALFGRRLAAAAVIGVSTAIMLAWGLAVAGGSEGFGGSPMSVAIIGSNLVTIGIALTIVIRRLLSRLEDALTERERIGQRLAEELKETRRVGIELEHALETKELLLRELHHRVKNNMQVVMSLISLAHEDDPDPCDTAKRRVRALSLVNELALSRANGAAVDAGELFRTLASRSFENRFPEPPPVEVRVLSSVDLDPQSAGIGALLASDLLVAMVGLHPGVSLCLRACGPLTACAEIRFPLGFELPGGAMAPVLDNALVRGAMPEVEIAPLAREERGGPGYLLTIRG